MLPKTIPDSVIDTVSSVISAHYYSHRKLDNLLRASGAPGDAPEGNCEDKCTIWLKRCNHKDASVDPLKVLGQFIQKFMDSDDQTLDAGRSQIKNALNKNQLAYEMNGCIVDLKIANPTTKTLMSFCKSGDYPSIHNELDRALQNITTDPHASITAASSIIEALCKTYLDTFGLDRPKQQTVTPLWKSVQSHLGLNRDRCLGEDQRKIMQGLSSIVEGIGAFRTHIGSAHGRGNNPPPIVIAEARLAINAAHTFVIFIMERWHGTSIIA